MCYPHLQSIGVSQINELVPLIVLMPFPTTRGNKYLLVGVEYFSLWRMAWPLPKQSAAAITEASLHGYVLDKGVPERLLTDPGKTFLSKLLKEVCDLLGIKKCVCRPITPRRMEWWNGCTGPRLLC